MRLRFVSAIFISAITFGLGCGDNGDDGPDDEPFNTFQACFDEHHGADEGFDVHDAIEVCCIDHPIGGEDKNVVCGETAADCEAFVDANLDGSDVTEDDITSACEDYVVDRSM